eukprot:Blabericola_migrator_1__118@NODE_102_length_14292_cov_312_776380_g90_i0_p2_GENE_NODE_102_length_14292_cov_312_776380_g90_i0NODE_102_length_14292_cov_312_776380_g90_i0_p2_ORF_typecomplete_len666_score97_77RRM_1/PF00076_22/7_1e19RRM_1/PF00076_22/7_2e16RRM_1/PF00076_22/1_7e18RRM_5/PF13893_6/0_00018RRM_5/PF13893_6/0_00015RRM_5/PF13893_6/0_015RRM_7/PF16367_5/5_8e05RRM_7/PF16367_5/0_35RRM_7/PF16367_5/0_01Limkainb1/PF11608_8/0_00093Limkainb1/PF11608_8/22Limkainb1/PF11608_8/0_11DUF1866/PF08952_11/0_0053
MSQGDPVSSYAVTPQAAFTSASVVTPMAGDAVTSLAAVGGHYAALPGVYSPTAKLTAGSIYDFSQNGPQSVDKNTPTTTGDLASPEQYDHQLDAAPRGSGLMSPSQSMEQFMSYDQPGSSQRSPQQPVDLRRQLCDQNLFIFHLPSDWRENELKEAFAPFGNILSAKVVKRPDGSSKGYGFVCFEHQQDAMAAASQMNGYSVGGKRLKVSLKKTPEECLNLQVKKLLDMAEQNEAYDRDRDCSLFVFHLPPHWDDKDLREKFVPFGPVIAAKVSRKEDGTSRGYGFVTCSDPRAAAMAILNLNGLEVCNKRLKVQPKQLGSGTHPRPDCTIFVFHLPNDWTDAVLRQFFSGCGRVVSATVQRDVKGRSRGFGFVTFDRTQAARDAVEEMNGVSVGIKRLKVSLKRTTADAQRWAGDARSSAEMANYETRSSQHSPPTSDHERPATAPMPPHPNTWANTPPKDQRTDLQDQPPNSNDPYGDMSGNTPNPFYPWKAVDQYAPAVAAQNQRLAAALKNHAPALTAAYLPRYAPDYGKPDTTPAAVSGYPANTASQLQHASMLLSPLLNNTAVKGLQNQTAQLPQRVHLTSAAAAGSPAHLLAYTAGTAFQHRPMWGLGIQPGIPYTHPSLTPAARSQSAVSGSRYGQLPQQQFYARPGAVPSRRPIRT